MALSTNDRGCIYVRIGRYSVNTQSDLERPLTPSNHFVYDTKSPEIVFVVSGFCVSDAIKASRIIGRLGLQTSVYNVVEHGVYGDAFVSFLSNKKVVVAYNGDPNVISYPLCKKMQTQGITIKKLIEVGFKDGQTGSLSDLKKAYGLDYKSLVRTVLELA